MGRVMAIDYGTRRTGIAVTDSLRIAAHGLRTLPTQELEEFLARYLHEEDVDIIVVGEPLLLDGRPAEIHHLVVGLVRKLRKSYPGLKVVTRDERFTSKEAKEVILRSGARKKKRRDKSLVDMVSATLILQDYMESQGW